MLFTSKPRPNRKYLTTRQNWANFIPWKNGAQYAGLFILFLKLHRDEMLAFTTLRKFVQYLTANTTLNSRLGQDI